MKTIFTAIFLFLATTVFSQKIKSTDYIKSNQLYLTYKNHNISFDAINRSTIVKLLGKPIRIKKEKWETNGATWTRTYVYTDGEIVLEDNSLSFIDVKKAGWAFSFKYRSGFTRPFTPGGDVKEIIKLFPNSWANRRDNTVSVQIESCDCSIIFETDGVKIKAVSFFSDES